MSNLFEGLRTFDGYQTAALPTVQYPDAGRNMVYPALGLVGEAGEAADKVKKFWRNLSTMDAKDLSKAQRTELAKEIGDVLWYAAALSREIGISLQTIAAMNIEKLMDRQARGVIKSEGDNR